MPKRTKALKKTKQPLRWPIMLCISIVMLAFIFSTASAQTLLMRQSPQCDGFVECSKLFFSSLWSTLTGSPIAPTRAQGYGGEITSGLPGGAVPAPVPPPGPENQSAVGVVTVGNTQKLLKVEEIYDYGDAEGTRMLNSGGSGPERKDLILQPMGDGSVGIGGTPSDMYRLDVFGPARARRFEGGQLDITGQARVGNLEATTGIQTSMLCLGGTTKDCLSNVMDFGPWKSVDSGISFSGFFVKKGDGGNNSTNLQNCSCTTELSCGEKFLPQSSDTSDSCYASNNSTGKIYERRDEVIVRGNVGIGTATPPTEKLQIGNSLVYHDGGNKVLAFNFSPSQGKMLVDGFPAEIRYGHNEAGKTGVLKFNLGDQYLRAGAVVNNTNGFNSLVIREGGNIGIGTDAPKARLDIYQTAISGKETIRSDDQNGVPPYIYAEGGLGSFIPDNIDVGDIIIAAGQSRTVTKLVHNAALLVDSHFSPPLTTGTNYQVKRSPLRIGDEAGPYLFVAGNGKVGIGTTTPQGLLDVKGSPRYAYTKPVAGVSSPRCPGDNDNNDNRSAIISEMPRLLVGTKCYDLIWRAPSNEYEIIDGSRFVIDSVGNVGIGTASPQYSLDVSGVIALGGGAHGNLDQGGNPKIDLTKLTDGRSLIGWNFTAGGGETDFIANRGAGSVGGFRFYDYSNSTDLPAYNAKLLLNIVPQREGNTVTARVGINKSNPGYALDVGGDINVSDQLSLGNKRDHLAVSHERIGLDVAELFNTEENVDVGDVLVVGAQERMLKKSSLSYQKGIVGVVSEFPAILFEGGQLKIGSNERRFDNPRKPPVALIGRIPVKVSLENGPIKVGDYLTTSSQSGVAMKATQSGMAIGVALENYSQQGIGKVLMLLNVGVGSQETLLKNLESRIERLEKKK